MATSLIPNGTSKEFKLSKKNIDPHIRIFTDDGSTWDGSTTSGDLLNSSGVSNSFTSAIPTGRVWLHQYTAKTKSTIKRNDIEIVQVLPKVFASNSHSIYKGGNAVYSAGMGVSTGDTFESKVLENAEISSISYDYLSQSLPSTILAGTIVKIGTNLGGTYDPISVVRKDAIFEAKYQYVGTVTGYNEFGNPNYWNYIGIDGIDTPTHNTIALDNSGDKAVKYFLALGKDSDNNAYGVVASKEMKWDYDYNNDGSDDAIVTVVAGTTSVVRAKGARYKLTGFTDSMLNNHFIEIIIDSTNVTWTAYDLNNFFVANDGITILNRTDDSVWNNAKIFVGNGFGDSNEFEQLIDGTDTDDNGNIVKTDISYIPLNYKMEN